MYEYFKARINEIQNSPRVPYTILKYDMPNCIWTKVKPFLPSSRSESATGKFKYKTTSRTILSAIFYKLFTSESWDDLEIDKGASPNLAYHKFIEYEKSGFFRKISKLTYPSEETEETGMQNWLWLNHTDRIIDRSTRKKPKIQEPLTDWKIIDK